MTEEIVKPEAGAGNKLTLQDEGGTQTLTVADGAKVGIGTDSPAVKFHVADNYPDWSSKLVNTHSGGYGYVSSAGSTGTYAMLLLDYSEANTLFGVRGSGEITKPKQPSFTVYPSSTQSNLAINTYVGIDWGTELIDNGGNFGSDVFTAPVAGNYWFSCSLVVAALNITSINYFFVALMKNASYYRNFGMIDPEAYDAEPAYVTLSSSCVMTMAASDTAGIAIYQSGGTAQADVVDGSTFSGFLIG